MLPNHNTFFDELKKRSTLINDYILDERFISCFHPEDVRWAVTAYVRYGGKRLRPAILMFSCGAVGGDEKIAIPAAAAVEIFHTWTLVHDDIIDRDPLRRGQTTVHQHYHDRSLKDEDGLRLSPEEAQHYGVSVAILTGDIQHGWGISMMAELSTRFGVNPEVTLDLINELDTRVLNTLVEGEVLDIQFAHRDIETLTPEIIEDMLCKKTGALYEFCGRAGAIIGVGTRDDPRVDAVAQFTAKCGTAFQLQDDILGIIGKEESLGKPIGSDLREGKRTLVIYYAYHNANDRDKNRITSVLGNQSASDEDITKTISLLRDLGGIDNVAMRAKTMIEEACSLLDDIPASHYRDLLYQWADFLIQREF
ncbi:MAG: polyprenyl synthetase family protein [Candidatus Hatepunaea meridiana]|nr:polyprenyl synthetase family protein [Candidatus Hatepunaea meridiana]